MALNITGMERSPCMRRWITATGRVHGKTTPGHTGGLVVFLQEIFSLCPRQQIHIILHSLSAHKTALVRAFLETPPPRVRFHFNAAYSSWFAGIEREVIAHGVFTSVPDFARSCAAGQVEII